MSTSSDKLRLIALTDARAMDRYGESLDRAACDIDRLRRALEDALRILVWIKNANDSDYPRPDAADVEYLRHELEATK